MVILCTGKLFSRSCNAKVNITIMLLHAVLPHCAKVLLLRAEVTTTVWFFKLFKIDAICGAIYVHAFPFLGCENYKLENSAAI